MGADMAHGPRENSQPAATHAPARAAGGARGGSQRTVVERAPLATGTVLRLQRTYGNDAVQRLLRRASMGAGLIQRTPLSDDLARSSAGKTPGQIFALVGQQKFQDGARDPAELSALTAVLKSALSDPKDQWMADKLLAGRLGMSSGVSRTEAPKALAKDIPPQPVEVHFVQGATDQRALVIAGVHGKERQGIDVARMLLVELARTAPYYSVILVPSLFPQNADKAWGVEGRREGKVKTNRNFPKLSESAASYKEGKALDASGTPLQAAPVPTTETNDKGKQVTREKIEPILLENVMLMELIDKFHPSRIISIHGTHDPSTAGIFADPQFMSPAKKQRIDIEATVATVLAQAAGAPVTRDMIKQVIEAQQVKQDEEQTQNDIDLAFAAAYRIDKQTKGIHSLGKRTFPNAAKSPSVAGNTLYKGAGNENPGWAEDLDKTTHKIKDWDVREKEKGVSLGLYGPSRGISVFTVEPPVDRALEFYDDKKKRSEPGADQKPSGNVVPKADREAELQAYAEAVATILLGPDKGVAALNRERAAAAPAGGASKP